MAAPTLTTRARSLADPSGVVLAGGVLLTLALSTLVGKEGLTFRIEALFGLCRVRRARRRIRCGALGDGRGLIPLFAVLPTLKVFVSPTIGALKDVVTLAAISAAGLVLLRRRVDRRPAAVDGGGPDARGSARSRSTRSISEAC